MSTSIEQKLDRLLLHFESDPSIGHVGIAERLEIIEKRVDKIENMYKIIYRVGITLGGIVTFALGKSWGIFKSLL